MAQPTARHEGDRGREKGIAVSQTPLSGSSIRSASVHVCTLSPLVCRPPEDERLQGWKRFLMEQALPGIPLWLRNSKRSWSHVRIPSPLPHFRPIFRLLQSSALHSTPITPPQIFKHSDRSSELPNPLQCRCHSTSCELARWIRSGCIWTHSSSHTSSLSASEGGGALECPLTTAVLWFLMEDVVIMLSASFPSFHPRFILF